MQRYLITCFVVCFLSDFNHFLFAAVPYYSPATAANHTSSLIDNPYVFPTFSGNDELIIGSSYGWTVPYIPSHGLYGYKITDSSVESDKAKIVMISGNHNGEDAGNWVLQGAIDFLVGEDIYAARFRQMAEVYVYPMVNPDGRYTRTGRGNPEMLAGGYGTDHNRVWNTTGLSTIDAFTQAMINDTSGNVDYFLDFHSLASSNCVLTVPELIDSDFILALLDINPALLAKESIGETGMARLWAMSSAGLNARYAYTPEQHHLWSDESLYLDLGVDYAQALIRVIVPEPAMLLFLSIGGLIISKIGRKKRSKR